MQLRCYSGLVDRRPDEFRNAKAASARPGGPRRGLGLVLVPLILVVAQVRCSSNPPAASGDKAGATAAPRIPDACFSEWRVVPGGSGVVTAEARATALAPVLGGLRERVCSCAKSHESWPERLVYRIEVTPSEGEGHADLEKQGLAEASLEQCAAHVDVRYAPMPLGSCGEPDGGHGKIVYPLIVPLVATARNSR